MEKLICSLLLVFLSSTSTGFAQFKVHHRSLDSIQAVVESKPAVFRKLGERAINRDTSLTLDDYIVLYYGSAYTESYAPYAESTQSSSVRDLLGNEKVDEALKMALSLLEANPSFTEMYYLVGVCYNELGDEALGEQYFRLFAELISVPIYSGDGLSEETAFIVRSVKDEYLIMDILGYSSTKQSLLTDTKTRLPYDMMDVKDEEGDDGQLYFNIYQPFKLGMAKMFNFSDDNSKPKKDKKKKKKK